jgi:protocatechuate 3,4-dioxygenase, alpha subunit
VTRPTASQTVGPFFAVGLDWPGWDTLVTDATEGERIVVEGRVLDGDGSPVPDALIEVWQADADGHYAHPEDEGPADPSFKGFGRVATDDQGRFRFRTIRPGRVPGPGNTLQAPHILIGVLARGLLKRLVTRLYFDGDPANHHDLVLSRIEDEARRRTLLARAEGDVWRFDVVLQGEGETVFFDG